MQYIGGMSDTERRRYLYEQRMASERREAAEKAAQHARDNPPVFLWEILVPTVRRVGGKPYTTRFHRVWDAKVREITGGLTILTPAKGQWVAPDGELHAERMIPVRIVATRDQIDQIISHTMTYYDQLAVLCYKLSEEVIIKHRA